MISRGTSFRLFSGGRREHAIYALFKTRQVAFDYRPDYGDIYAEVVMNQNVPHADDLGPRHFQMTIPEVGRERACRLADDLQVMQNPDLN